MFEWISMGWALNDPLPKDVDVIALISYAATTTHLTNGSRRTTGLAAHFAKSYPNAVIVGGIFSKNSGSIEWMEKEMILNGYPNKMICVGPVSSTTDECEAILKASGNAKSIIIVCEGWHSRRVRIVWKHFFTGEMCFQSVSGHRCADPKNPMWMHRYSMLWATINICLTPFFKFFPGVGWFARKNFSQPAR